MLSIKEIRTIIKLRKYKRKLTEMYVKNLDYHSSYPQLNYDFDVLTFYGYNPGDPIVGGGDDND